MVQTRGYKRIRGDSNAPRPCIGHAMEAASVLRRPISRAMGAAASLVFQTAEAASEPRCVYAAAL